MYDLCVRKEQFAADGAMESQTEMEALVPQRDKPEEMSAKDRDASLIKPAGTGGTNIAALRASILGKRHHSLYEGLNGCEVGGFGKNGTDYGYLVRQNSELLRALDELEKTCAKLREENGLLRKSSSPETEEKVKRLKRKNAELAVIAKRLEERARKLQEANLKVVNAPALVRGGGVEQYKRAFARQRARDLAQHADTLLSKDKEIASLQQECRALQARLGQGKGSPGLLATSGFETLLRESQKEVLRLQRQLSVSSAKEPASGTGQEKAQSENPSPVTDEGPRPPEDTSGLKEQRPSVTPGALSSPPEDHRLQELESELSKKRKECESLEHEVKKRQRKCLDLEHELEDVRGKHASLEEEAQRLRLKAQLLKQVQAENDELRDSLSTVTAQRNSALQENQRLQAKLENLEQVLKHMREVAERRQQLELEHEEALTILKLKQEEVKRLQKAQVAAKKEHEGVVQLLEVKVQELEEKCRSQSEQFGLLSHELERFRLQAAKFDLLSSSLDPPSPLTNGLELSGEKDLEVTPPAAHTALAAEPAKEQPLEAEELSIQHQGQPTASSTNSEPEPAAGTPKSDSRQLPPKSESLPHSTPKSCPTPEVDTASEVEELDIDVSPIPEPENRAPAKLQVFIARYSYNPFDGPNENPEAELPLTAGEYIYVYGDMDEDGFYEGELMDGRRGLVPSNFVERISDDDMLSFHPPEVSDLSHNSFQESSFHSSSEKHLRLSIHNTEKTDPSVPEEEETLSGLGKVDSLMSNGFDLDMEEVGDDAVPYPRKLTLIKQLAKSIIIGWDPPLVPAGWGNVWSYNVYVDKELRLNVPFGSQTKAVLERLDVNLKAYRVSVQSVTEKGDSDQLRCSILVGRDVCVAPTQLKVESTTATSASLAWLPSNSNYVHAVFLNDEECEIVKAGCYSHCLSNLRPNLRYRVKVEARPHRTPWELPLDRRERKCAVTSFVTLTAGPPDAPLDVQVELGPSPGIALVSWLPVTIDAAGTSNGVRVTGYAIYADKQKVLEVASPTAGSVLVGPSQMHILQAAQELTVRTMSTYGESTDSVPVKIPAKLFAATAPCQPLPTPPSASSLLEVSMHSAPMCRDPLDSTTATAPQLLASALWVEPPVALAAREASVPTFPKANLGDGMGAALHREERTESASSVADSLPAVGASTSSLVLHEGSSVSNFHLGHTVDVTSSSGTGRLLDSTKDSESIVVKRPSVSITDFLEEAVSSADSSSSVAEMSMESSQGLPGESAGRTEDQDQVPSGSHSHCLDTSGLESEHEAEEESSHGNVRVVSMDEFLDHNLQKTGLGNIPSHHDPYLRPKEDPVNDHRLSEYQTESSRGSDLSDILEEDEEDLCSDALGTEEGEEQSGGLGVGDGSKETSADGDPRLPHSAEAVSWRGLNGFSPKMDHLETRPAKDAPRAETPEATECSEVEGLAADSTVRIFVALFQYDPAVMSPNPDATEEELPFKEGQIIKIYGDKDADGFYRGESGGRLGYVPCNMVSEIQVEDEETRDQLLQQGFLSAEASMEKIVESAGVWEESVGSSRERSWPGSGPHSVAPRKMVAIFDYDPRESSPNVDIEAELTFSAGDIIVVFGDMDDDGFFYGESNGQQGLVPSNFLQAIPDKGVEAPGSVCEEKGLSESRRESQVSLAPSEEQNESPVATVEEAPDPSSALNIVLPQVMTPETPNQSETSPQGKKKKGFFSKGKKLFKKLGSSKKE